MSDDIRLIDLICEWQDRRARGESISVEDICRESPHLLEPFKAELARVLEIDALLTSTSQTARTRVQAVDVLQTKPLDGDNNSRSRSVLPPPNLPGYEILEQLGIGGMGAVYKARQIAANRLVAVKVIRWDKFDFRDERVRQRFEIEARAIARLNHPHIVTIHEVGEHEGQPFFSMEFLPGGNLAGKLDGTPLRPQESALIVAKLANGMAAAHAAGIVHRDLKPGNVLITSSGDVKITDFGLAKSSGREPLGRIDGSKGPQNLTNAGALMGTLSYMAPEQASGPLTVGPPADIYALGTILYECLTGRPPFKGESDLDTLEQLCYSDPVPLRQIQPRTPRDLETICLKCLRKEPERRYATAQDLAVDLSRFLDGKPILARPVGRVERAWKWVRRNPVIAALIGLVFVTMAMGTTISVLKSQEAKENERLANNLAKVASAERDEVAKQKKEVEDGLAKISSLLSQEKENRRLADLDRLREANLLYASNQIERARSALIGIEEQNQCMATGILKRRYEGGLFTLYGHTMGVDAIAINNDGTRIVSVSRDGTARVWNAVTGDSPPTLLLRSTDPDLRRRGMRCVALSGDGRHIVIGCNDSTVKVLDSFGGPPKRTLSTNGPVSSVAVNHDASWIVAGGESGTVRVWDLRGEIKEIDFPSHEYVNGSRDVYAVAMSRDGSRMVSGGHDGLAKIWNTSDAKAPLRQFKHGLAVRSVVLNPDGSRLISGCFDGLARIWDVQNEERPLVELLGTSDAQSPRAEANRGISTSSIGSVALSADGSRIVTGSFDGTVRIWRSSGERRPLFELKGHSERVLSVAFTPDGSRVATGSFDGTIRVWDARQESSTPELKGHDQEVTGVAIHSGSSRLVTAAFDGLVNVWNGRSGQSIVRFRAHEARIASMALSENGKVIVTGSFDTTARIWDGATGNPLLADPLKHEKTVSSVAISKDGQRIVTGSVDGKVRIWNLRNGFSAEKPIELESKSGRILSVAITPDGGRVVAGTDDRTVRVWDVASGECLHEWQPPLVLPTFRGKPKEGMPKADALAELANRPGEAIWSVAISQMGTWVVVGHSFQQASVWELQSVGGQRSAVLRAELVGHRFPVRGIAISKDGQRIVTAGKDRSARIWDARTGRQLLELRGDPEPLLCVAISDDPQVIVAGSAAGTTRIWDSLHADQLLQIEGNVDPDGIITLRADNDFVVATAGPADSKKANFPDTILVAWRVRDGKICKPPPYSLAGMSERTPDGKYMFLRSGSRVVRVPIQPSEDERLRRTLLARSGVFQKFACRLGAIEEILKGHCALGSIQFIWPEKEKPTVTTLVPLLPRLPMMP